MTDEAEIVRRCQRSEAVAQRLLYDCLSNAMLPLCLRYIRVRDEAEAAMVAGFFKAFQHIGGFEYKGHGSLEAWLRRIMVNECLMRLRAGSHLKPAALDDAAEDEIDSSADQLQQLAAKDLLRLIAALPDGYRTVFNLYAVEGYSHREIAALLDISEGTSKSQYSRAKALLRAAIKPQTETQYAIR